MEDKKAGDAADAAPAVEPAPVASAPVSTQYEAARPGAFSLEQLQQAANQLPGVEPHEKEKWLSDSEFQTVFAMGRTDFDGLAKWKKDGAKKKAGLF